VSGGTATVGGTVSGTTTFTGGTLNGYVKGSGGAPTITTHPASQTVTEGDNVTFTVAATATGTPSPYSYQWQVYIDDFSSWLVYSGATASTFTITNVTNLLGFSKVRCVVTNYEGSVTSNEATLTVTGAATVPVTLASISGVTAPVTGATAVTSITATAQYTGTVTWSPAPGAGAIFATGTVYTATITLTPLPGYTLSGVTQDFFTVAGATTVTNAANSGVVTAVFPATGTPPPPPPPPSAPIKRQIYLPAAEGFTYNIRAGYHYVDSRSDFPFIIITTTDDTPGHLKAAGHPLDNLKVTTGTARDTNGGVILERIALDSMRVTIKMVNQNIRITVTGGTPDGTETVESAKVWSYGGALHLYSPTSGTAQVFSLTGQLVKTLTFASGETASATLARGIYIVRIDGKTWKVSLNQDL
jgi:hypothetical protein